MRLVLPPLAAASIVVLAACGPPEVCGPLGAPTPTPTSPSLRRAHAHNDYEHERPLEDALAAGFGSVEVDVWHRDAAVVVSHDPWTSRGTLAGLYLDPLEARVAGGGTVHGDGAPFVVWLDLKDGSRELRALIAADLAGRTFLRRFEDGEGLEDTPTHEGQVAVIVTGDAAAKEALLDDVAAPRPFLVDVNHLPPPADVGPADALDPRVGALSLSFPAWVGAWDGQGAPPPGIRERVACIVARAHTEGPLHRVVRLFGGPDTPAAWDLSLSVGVDFLHTDQLQDVARHLDGR